MKHAMQSGGSCLINHLHQVITPVAVRVMDKHKSPARYTNRHCDTAEWLDALYVLSAYAYLIDRSGLS
jgi:hypothetical protein